MFKTGEEHEREAGVMNEHIAPATGTHTTNGRPHGWTSLTPHIVVSPAKAALEFYRDVLGATVGPVTEMGGLVAHAEVAFESGRLTLGEPMEGFALTTSATEGPVSFSFGLYVPDVDRVVERALAAGARLREPVTSFASGDRFGSILDPFGVRWSVMTRIEDLSAEESARRVEAWAAAQGTG